MNKTKSLELKDAAERTFVLAAFHALLSVVGHSLDEMLALSVSDDDKALMRRLDALDNAVMALDDLIDKRSKRLADEIAKSPGPKASKGVEKSAHKSLQ